MKTKVLIERRKGGFLATVTEKNGCWINSTNSDFIKDEMTRPTVDEAIGALVHGNPWLFSITIEEPPSKKGADRTAPLSRMEEDLARQDNE